ncbi:MAG: hypothetical protein WC600_17090 [Desulfobaccales bacterium]
MSQRLQEFLDFFGEETKVLRIELAHEGGETIDQDVLVFLGEALRVAGLALEGRCRTPILCRPSRPITFAEMIAPLTPGERMSLAKRVTECGRQFLDDKIPVPQAPVTIAPGRCLSPDNPDRKPCPTGGQDEPNDGA